MDIGQDYWFKLAYDKPGMTEFILFIYLPACAYSYANTMHSVISKLQVIKLRTVLVWPGTFQVYLYF